MYALKYYDNKVLSLTGYTDRKEELFYRTLRCLPNIAFIFVLIRQKKGNNLIDRFKREIFDSQGFDRLRKIYGSGFNKFINQMIYPIEGDTLKEGLGLSKNDMEAIINSVDCNTRLDDAIQINVRGPQTLWLQHIKQEIWKNFIRISTTYVNSDKRGYIEEKYIIQVKRNQNSQLLQTPVSVLEKNVQDIIGNFLNTYMFTIQSRLPNFSFTLIRPSIIGVSWKDPVQDGQIVWQPVEHIIEHYESCSIETIKNAIITYSNRRCININKKVDSEQVTIIISDSELKEVEAQVKKYLKNNYYKSIQNPIDIARSQLDYTIKPKL